MRVLDARSERISGGACSESAAYIRGWEISALISEPVAVDETADGVPSRFAWRGGVHHVADVLSDLREVDYQRDWKLRRHRRRVTVRTETGRYFDLYVERRGVWILYRELDDPFR